MEEEQGYTTFPVTASTLWVPRVCSAEAVKEVMVCGDYSTASETSLLGSKPCSASSGCVTLSQSLNLSVPLFPICKVKKK